MDSLTSGCITAGEIFAACDAARADPNIEVPMVDFVVDFDGHDVGAFYVYPHVGLRQYCVTHWSHQGPDRSECDPSLDAALTHDPSAHGQWPAEHLADGWAGFIRAPYGFRTEPCQGSADCYATQNQHCAVDRNGWASGPNIDGGRIRFNCDCQETVIRQIIAFTPRTWSEQTPVYWFTGI